MEIKLFLTILNLQASIESFNIFNLNRANPFLGASALPSVKKAASGLEPPPTILATGQNNNRKKLQLQFSFQEKSVSDDEENDDEIGSFAFVSQNHIKKRKIAKLLNTTALCDLTKKIERTLVSICARK